MLEFPSHEKIIEAANLPAEQGAETWREILGVLTQYQDIRNSGPREKKRKSPMFDHNPDFEEMMARSYAESQGREPPPPRYTDEEKEAYKKKAEEWEKYRDFWAPVISLRSRMACGYWEPRYNPGPRMQPVSMYKVYDFRLDITDAEWDEICVITGNYFGKDCRFADLPRQPAAMDYLASKRKFRGLGRNEVLDRAAPEEILDANTRASRKTEEMRGKLLNNKNKYAKVAAIICATNGYVNAAVMKRVRELQI
jgi:hypothetical protein